MIRKKSNIYLTLSKKYNLPVPVIEVVCNSPFKFAKEKIADNNNVKSIMFAYLFKYKLKKKYLNEQSFVKLKENELGNATENIQ